MGWVWGFCGLLVIGVLVYEVIDRDDDDGDDDWGAEGDVYG